MKINALACAGIVVLLAGGLYAQAGQTKPKTKPKAGSKAGAGKMVTTASGLKYQDIKVGKGPVPKQGQTVVVHYTGTLTNGTKFDSSRDRGQPFEFQYGVQPVIQGWVEGLSTMRVGGRRKLIIPPSLGYGERDMGRIPPNSTLLFDVELLGIK